MVQTRFMIKLFMERCLECTSCAVFWAYHWCILMIYLLRNMILPQSDMSLFFILHLSPVTQLTLSAKRVLKRFCERCLLSANDFPYKSFANTFQTMSLLLSTWALVRQKEMISPVGLQVKCSFNPWQHPIVPFPLMAIPLNTLWA